MGKAARRLSGGALTEWNIQHPRGADGRYVKKGSVQGLVGSARAKLGLPKPGSIPAQPRQATRDLMRSPSAAISDADWTSAHTAAQRSKLDSGFTSLADWRANMSHLSRSEQDALLRRLASVPGVHVIPVANLKDQPQAHADASIEVGGRRARAIRFDEQHAGLVRAEGRAAPKPTPTRPDIDADIHRAVAKLRRDDQAWVSLADVRDELGEKYPRPAVDAALLEIALQRRGSVTPKENQKTITQRDRDGAMVVHGDERHLISMPRSMAGEPPAATAADAPGAALSDEVRTARQKLQQAATMHGSDRSKWSKKDRAAAAKLDAVIAKAGGTGGDTTPAGHAAHLKTVGSREEAEAYVASMGGDEAKAVLAAMGATYIPRLSKDAKRAIADWVGSRLTHDAILRSMSAPVERPGVPSARTRIGASRPGPAPGTPEHDAKIDADIRAAYDRLNPGTGAPVSLIRLRHELEGTGVTRADLDRRLRALDRARVLQLDPDANRKAHTQEVRDGAIEVGGDPKHLVSFPTAAAAKGTSRKRLTAEAVPPAETVKLLREASSTEAGHAALAGLGKPELHAVAAEIDIDLPKSMTLKALRGAIVKVMVDGRLITAAMDDRGKRVRTALAPMRVPPAVDTPAPATTAGQRRAAAGGGASRKRLAGPKPASPAPEAAVSPAAALAARRAYTALREAATMEAGHDVLAGLSRDELHALADEIDLPKSGTLKKLRDLIVKVTVEGRLVGAAMRGSRDPGRSRTRLANPVGTLPTLRQVPESAKPYHRSVEGIEDIAQAVEAREFADIRPLTGGKTADTSLVTLADGSKLVRKSRGNPTAEHAASILGRAMGIDVPRVYRNNPSEVWMEYVADGRSWAQIREVPGGIARGQRRAQAAIQSDEGKVLGLFDLMTNNIDRNDGNWLIRDDDSLVAIDHGNAFTVPDPSRADLARRGVFSDHYFRRLAGLQDNELTPADITELRRRLRGLEPDFAHIGQPEWLRYALLVLDAVEPHAKGTRNLVTGAAR